MNTATYRYRAAPQDTDGDGVMIARLIALLAVYAAAVLLAFA